MSSKSKPFRRHVSLCSRAAALLVAAVTAWIPVASAGEPPPSIHRAVRDDDTLEMRRWLSKDIKLLNARDSDGMTPLQIAVCKNRRRAFDFLIASGANAHLGTGLCLMKIDREDGTMAFRTPRSQWTALHLAAYANRLEMAKVLLTRGARVGVRNDRDETPLFLAATEGHVGMIRLLIANGADIEAGPKKQRFTPLMTAVFNGHLEAGQLLIANGARPDVLSAAGLGMVSEMESAIRADGRRPDGDGGASTSPLYWAAQNGQIRAVMTLVDRGAKLEAKDEQSRTPIMAASMMGHVVVVRYLAEHGANVDEWDRRGWTSLHLAAVYDQPRVARALVSMGAKTDVKDLRGRTAVELAREKGHLDVVEVIMESSSTVSEHTGGSPARLTGGH